MTDAKPILYEGALAVDDRGTLAFVNSFDFAGASMMPPVRRFYLVSNHQVGMIRAWHGHKKEAKYVIAVSGTALVCAVGIGGENPALADPDRFILSASEPAVLVIPPGYANGWMSLTPDARLMFFSTSTLEESKTDDYRFPARYWNPWKVEER